MAGSPPSSAGYSRTQILIVMALVALPLAVLAGPTAGRKLGLLSPRAAAPASQPATEPADDLPLSWQAHPAPVLCVAVSPDGKTAVSGAELLRDADATVFVWDLITRQNIGAFVDHHAGVSAIAFTPDGKYVLSGGRDRTLRLWDVRTQEEVATFPGHTNRITSLAISRDAPRAISAAFDSEVRVWDLADKKPDKQPLRTLAAGELGATAVAITPDGKRALVGGHKSIDLWDLDTGQHLATLNGHSNWVFSVAFSPDGTRALSGGYDKSVILWDLTDPAAPRLQQTLTGHTDSVRSVTFTPNGRCALSAGDDHSVRLWDLSTGRHEPFDGHGWVVTQVAAFADGGRAISCDWLGFIRLWNLSK